MCLSTLAAGLHKKKCPHPGHYNVEAVGMRFKRHQQQRARFAASTELIVNKEDDRGKDCGTRKVQIGCDVLGQSEMFIEDCFPRERGECWKCCKFHSNCMYTSCKQLTWTGLHTRDSKFVAMWGDFVDGCWVCSYEVYLSWDVGGERLVVYDNVEKWIERWQAEPVFRDASGWSGGQGHQERQRDRAVQAVVVVGSWILLSKKRGQLDL